MAIRIRVKISIDKKNLETIALLNSGYEAETSQILVPIQVAEILELWPPKNAIESTYETAGGPLRIWVYPRKCSVCIEEEIKLVEANADLVISPIADEVLINDKLIGELQIILEDAGKGLWRLRSDPQTRIRYSNPPKYWK